MPYRNEFDVGNKACYSDLYDQIQKVRYKVGGRDDKLSLNVKVSLAVRYGFNDEKILKVVITDNDNPLLLFSAEIDGELYAALKQKLGLLIDFSQFPHQLVGLLARCASDDHVAPKYVLTLEEAAADPGDPAEGGCVLLKIVEVNQFQRLCLIALRVSSGSQTEVNAFMARNIQLLKRQIAALEATVRNADEKRALAEENLLAKNTEMERLKLQANEQMKLLKRKCDEELADMKRSGEFMSDEYEKKANEAIREAEHRHRRATAKLEEALEKHKSEMNALKADNVRLEMELVNKGETANKLVCDIKMLQDEILRSEEKVARLESEAKEKSALLVSVRQRATHLEKEKEDRDKAIKKLTSLLEAAESNKNHLRTVLKDKLDSLDAQKENLSSVAQDLAKANEIITKITKENKQIKNKVSERTKIALQQEKVIRNLQESISKGQRLLQEKCDRIRHLEEENERLSGLLKSCEEEVKSKEETIRKNERVIGWLNDIISKQTPTAVVSKSSNLSPKFPFADPELVNGKLIQAAGNSADNSRTNTTSRKILNKNLTKNK